MGILPLFLFLKSSRYFLPRPKYPSTTSLETTVLKVSIVSRPNLEMYQVWLMVRALAGELPIIAFAPPTTFGCIVLYLANLDIAIGGSVLPLLGAILNSIRIMCGR